MLDKELQALLKLTQNSSYLKLNAIPVAQVRHNVKALAALTALPATDIGRVEEQQVRMEDGNFILLRFYYPVTDNEKMPALVYFHGGGFVLYDLDDYDSFCRYLTATANVVVIAVDYRRAPEFKFPQPYRDAEEAVQWVFKHAGVLGIDTVRIGIGGDSAGGSLAIHVARCHQQYAAPLLLQLLIYPVLVFNKPFNSYEKYGEGYFLNKNTIDWFWNQLENKEVAMDTDPRLHPYLLPDLGILPATILAVAEYDILRDEGLTFHHRLLGAGKESALLYFDDLAHNFILLSGKNKASARAVDVIAGALRNKIYHQ